MCLQQANSEATVVAFLIFPTKTNNFNVESLRGQAISKQLKETVHHVQTQIGKRIFEQCLRYSLNIEMKQCFRCSLITEVEKNRTMSQGQCCCSGRTVHAEYMSCYRGKIPTGDEILEQEDVVKLKRCIYSAQVNLCRNKIKAIVQSAVAIYLLFVLSFASYRETAYLLYVHTMYVKMLMTKS